MSWCRGRPEEQTQNRPSYFVTANAPGSDLAGNYAAALALTSVAIGASDAAYSQQLLAVARQLYTFAFNNRGKYSNSMPEAAAFYKYSNRFLWIQINTKYMLQVINPHFTARTITTMNWLLLLLLWPWQLMNNLTRPMLPHCTPPTVTLIWSRNISIGTTNIKVSTLF